jgi:hypothetical protein
MKNTFIDNNFTEDQINRKKSNNESKTFDNWMANPIFDDVLQFQKKHELKIDIEIINKVLPNNHVLQVRRLIFLDDMNINTSIIPRYTWYIR